MLETYHGNCHCGRVRLRTRADLGMIGECNCSMCKKKGILHLPVPLDRFKLLCARCLDEIDVAALKPSRFFDERNWEAAFAARQAFGKDPGRADWRVERYRASD